MGQKSRIQVDLAINCKNKNLNEKKFKRRIENDGKMSKE